MKNINEEIKAEQVKEYVYTNYKTYKNKDLIITEHRTHFSVKVHKNGSPLVLGKSIIQ
jgi:hypothetical protein